MIEPTLINKKLTGFFVISQALAVMPLFAAGFQVNQTSPSLQGTAMAGAVAASNDVTALFNNPATLATLKQNQAYLGASEFLPRQNMSQGLATHTFNVSGDLSSELSAPVSGMATNKGINQSVFLPDAYLGERINDKLTFGLAINEPYYWSTNYLPDSVVRFSSLKTKIKSLNANPALAYKINDNWTIGAGFVAQYLKFTFENFNGPYSGFSLIDDLIAASHPTHLKANGWGYGYSLGTLYQPRQSTRIGLSYRSLISTRLDGRGEQYTTSGGIAGSPSHYFLYNEFTQINTRIKTPAVLTLGMAQDLNQWTLKATAQVSFWDSSKSLVIATPEAFITHNEIQMNWRNAWLGSLGADYRATPALTFRGGVAYEQTPATNQYRGPQFPDSNQISANIGLSYALTNHLSIDSAYSHLFLKNQKINITQAGIRSPNIDGPIEINQVRARYKGSVNIFALGLRYSC